MGKIEWIEYAKLEPDIGDLVLVYRNIESKQIYVTQWSIEEAKYSDWNEITHWAYINYPN